MIATTALTMTTGVVLGTTATVVYQTPDGVTSAIVDNLVFFNDTAGAVTIQLWVVPVAANAPAQANKLLEVPIPAHTPYTVPFKVTVGAGGAIKALASAGTAVSANAGVLEYGTVA